MIVGEAPGRRAGGLTRTRLTELAGEPWEDWADFVNLLPEQPAAARKGSSWDVRAARRAALELDVSGYDAVILLGRRVAQAMIAAGAGFPFFRWTEERLGPTGLAALPSESATPHRLAVIPHTSGIVRFWNDPASVARATEFLRETIRTYRGEVNHMTDETETTTPTEPDLQQELLARVRETETLAGVAEIEKKGYVRLSREDATLGYIHKATRTGVRVEIPATGGGYDKMIVVKRADIRKAVAALEKRDTKAKEAAPA